MNLPGPVESSSAPCRDDPSRHLAAPDLDPKVRALTFRTCRMLDEPAALRAFNEVFGGGRAHPDFVPRSSAMWRWQFLQNPFGYRYQVAVTPSGEIAAQYPCVPVPFSTPEGMTSIAQVVDILVRPEWRKGRDRAGPGTFAIVGERASTDCFGRGDAILYGYPMARALEMGRRFLRFEVVRIVDYLVRQVGAVAPELPADLTLEAEMPAPGELDRLEQAGRVDRPLSILRGAEWFGWRYARCPEIAYEFVQVRRAGRLVALAVLRRDHATAMRGCTLVDWLVRERDEEAFAAVVARAEATVREDGGQGIAAIVPPWAWEWEALRRQKFGVVPSAWTMERHLTYRVAERFQDRFPAARLRDEWYYTFGDSDLA